MKKDRLTCKKARDISIVSVLGKLGYFPKKITQKEAWFLSPFREETQPSFKVSIVLNRWYDHGEGFGGNIIDLVTRLKRCSILETLEFLSNDISNFSFQKRVKFETTEKQISYEIIKVTELRNHALITYLESRSISVKVANEFCKEIYYKQKGKTYFALAFKNDFGSFELRNKYFKGCIGKKGITTFNYGNTTVCVFEGFIDFLSYKTLHKNKNLEEDYIICNSTSLIRNLIPKLQKYGTISTYLDNDESGKKATIFLKENLVKINDGSMLYKGFNDINDYLVKMVT